MSCPMCASPFVRVHVHGFDAECSCADCSTSWVESGPSTLDIVAGLREVQPAEPVSSWAEQSRLRTG